MWVKMGLSHSMLGGTWLGGTWMSFVVVMLLGHPWLKDAKVGTPCRSAFGL
jgi:O-antigen ligase